MKYETGERQIGNEAVFSKIGLHISNHNLTGVDSNLCLLYGDEYNVSDLAKLQTMKNGPVQQMQSLSFMQKEPHT